MRHMWWYKSKDKYIYVFQLTSPFFIRYFVYVYVCVMNQCQSIWCKDDRFTQQNANTTTTTQQVSSALSQTNFLSKVFFKLNFDTWCWLLLFINWEMIPEFDWHLFSDPCKGHVHWWLCVCVCVSTEGTWTNQRKTQSDSCSCISELYDCKALFSL